MTTIDQQEALQQETRLRQSLERRPAEVYCDHLEVFEDRGVLRFVFSASRPEVHDKLGDPVVPVVRVAMLRKMFDYYFAEAKKEFDPPE